jgi:hypothetical protein
VLGSLSVSSEGADPRLVTLWSLARFGLKSARSEALDSFLHSTAFRASA